MQLFWGITHQILTILIFRLYKVGILKNQNLKPIPLETVGLKNIIFTIFFKIWVGIFESQIFTRPNECIYTLYIYNLYVQFYTFQIFEKE